MLAVAIFFLIYLNFFYQISIKIKSDDREWLEYKLKYKLNIPEVEEISRKDIFLKNHAFILKSNSKNTTFKLKMNCFGHLIKTSHAQSRVSAIESHFAIHTGNLTDLSVQEIVDCSRNFLNFGCDGGFPQNVYKYCIRNGLSTSLDYPYRGRSLECIRNNYNSSYLLAGYKNLKSGDEINLLRALYHIGPISIAIDAESDEYAFYNYGIIDFSSCSSVHLNHAVLAVGYSLRKRPYLLVKNSWGKNWGIGGYFKVALFKNNMCGIASDASYPIPKFEN
ncbi:hypothetical protein MXB_3368 [Myxobolus squamalis]|nr:hypothetical protein MXB_3368 [Myxobolus squamalis]